MGDPLLNSKFSYQLEMKPLYFTSMMMVSINHRCFTVPDDHHPLPQQSKGSISEHYTINPTPIVVALLSNLPSHASSMCISLGTRDATDEHLTAFQSTFQCLPRAPTQHASVQHHNNTLLVPTLIYCDHKRLVEEMVNLAYRLQSIIKDIPCRYPKARTEAEPVEKPC